MNYVLKSIQNYSEAGGEIEILRFVGYKELFEDDGREKVFNHNGFKVRIRLLLKPEAVSKALPEYKQYWFDNIEKMLEVMA